MQTRLTGFAAAAALTGIAVLLTAPSTAQQPAAPPAAPQSSGTPAPPARQEFVWPARITNARVLPADIGSERLRMTMVGFSRALGVRCQFCHVGQEGQPLSSFDFVTDANPHKDVARGMLRMTRRLNETDLAELLGASQAPRVTCFTCHRGSTTPARMPAAPPAQPPAQ